MAGGGIGGRGKESPSIEPSDQAQTERGAGSLVHTMAFIRLYRLLGGLTSMRDSRAKFYEPYLARARTERARRRQQEPPESVVEGGMGMADRPAGGN
jgi:hypothetical protein